MPTDHNAPSNSTMPGERFGLLLIAALAWRRVAARVRTTTLARPGMAVVLTGCIAAVLACHPVVFLGKSFVSPGNGGALLVYPGPPFLPGGSGETAEARGSDVGAMMWQWLPYAAVERRVLFEDGEAPWWNRYNSAGQPLLGQGQSMFGDPLQLIPLLTGGDARAWDARFVLGRALFASGCGLAVLAATGSLPAGLVLAASSAFLGVFVFRLNHAAVFALAWAPWLLVAWFRFSAATNGRTRAGGLVLLAGASVALLGSGTVKEAYTLCLFTHLTGALTFMLRSGRQWRRDILALGLTGLGTVLVAAPLWGSFAATLGQAFTLSDVPEPVVMPAVWFGGFFEALWFDALSPNHNVVMPSVNLLVLLGVAWAAVRAGRLYREPPFLACAACALAAFAFAFGLVPVTVIKALPLISNLQHVFNVFGCVLLIHVIVLAGFGVREAIVIARANNWLWYNGAALALAMLVLAVFPLSVVATDRSLYLDRELVGLLVTGLGGTVVLALLVRPVLAGWTSSGARVLVLALALAAIHLPHGMLTSAHLTLPAHAADRVNFARPSPAVAAIKAATNEPGRVAGINLALFPGYTGLIGLEGINGPDALVMRHYRELLDALGFPMQWSWLVVLDGPAVGRLARALDLLNVRWLAGAPGWAGPDAGRMLVRTDLDVVERPSAWPRAFFVDSVATYRGVNGFTALLAGSDGRPMAAVDAREQPALPMFRPVEPGTIPADRRIMPADDYHLTANSTAFSVDASGPGMIVLTETFLANHFSAIVNGQPVPLIRVNHAFKGILVMAAGHYRILVTCRPWYAPWLLVALVVGLLMVGLGLTVTAKRRVMARSILPPSF